MTGHSQLIPNPRDVAAHYDELDDVYRQAWGEHAHHGFWRTGRETIAEAVVALVDEVADAAAISPGTRVLDLGSGYGATGRHLARTRDAATTSLTISQRQHDHALIADAGDARLVQLKRDWFANGLPGDGFDVVIAIESVGHLPTRPALVEALRVLRPGGRIVVCDLVRADRVASWLQPVLIARMERESHLIPLVSIEEFRREFTAAGFVVDQTRDLTRQVRNTWPKGIARLLARLLRDRELRRALFGGKYENDGFLFSLIRMTFALRLGVVRYYLVSAHKLDPSGCVASR